jgi:HNH endonuclease
MPRKIQPISVRLWAKVTIGEPDECWLWTGYRIGAYGFIYRNENGRWMDGAHRVALELKLGRLLIKGEWSCHSCDNTLCINPNHLFLGNAQANTNDMIQKGRNRKGSGMPNAKLTEQNVIEIRRRSRQGEPLSTIALDYPASETVVSLAARNKTWKHVNEEAYSTGKIIEL